MGSQSGTRLSDRTELKRLSMQTSSARLMNSSSKSWPVDRGSHRSDIQRKTHVRYRYESICEAWFHPWCWLLWDISVSFKKWKGGFCNLNELKLLQILPEIYFYLSWTSLAYFCCSGPGLSSMTSAWKAAVQCQWISAQKWAWKVSEVGENTDGFYEDWAL